MKLYKYILCFFLFIPGVSVASDFSSLNVFIYAVVLVPYLVVFFIIWLIKRKKGFTRKFKTILFYVSIPILSPVPWGSSGVPWPSSFVLMVGDPREKANALGFVLVYILVGIVFSILLKVSDAADKKQQNELELEQLKNDEKKLESNIQKKLKK
jgi:hypothetical protein